MSSNDNNSNSLGQNLYLLLVGVGLATILVATYRLVTNGIWSRDPPRITRPQVPHHQQFPIEIVETPSNMENQVARLILAHKYTRDITGLTREDGSGTCAICLDEFEEGEEVRTLPQCSHTYHVDCIDMWLYSHSSCPVCRIEAIPSAHVLVRSRRVEASHNVVFLQNVMVNSGPSGMI